MLKLFVVMSICLTVVQSGWAQVFDSKAKPIVVVHVNLGNRVLAQQVESELRRDLEGRFKRPVKVIRPPVRGENNPFGVSPFNFDLGSSRLLSGLKLNFAPEMTLKMERWFLELEMNEIHPDIFIINGHHVPSLGFHTDEIYDNQMQKDDGSPYEFYTGSLYMQSLLNAAETSGLVRRFFESVKLVFIGGCWGLANFEPKSQGQSGQYLGSEEIRDLYFKNKKAVIGSGQVPHSLEYQRLELTTLYGADFVRSSAAEKCYDFINRNYCENYNVDRVMPDAGLFDGSHMYNGPYLMKKLFPKALAIFGFHRPSPREPGRIWQATFDEARARLAMNNILQPLISDQTSDELKKKIIQTLRASWTKNSYYLNRGRANGSITPFYPELDRSGPFAYFDLKQREYPDAPRMAPYDLDDGMRFLSANK